MTTITKEIEVNLPVRTVYDQWTQFESFPEFMEGVERVVQLDDRRLHWETEIALVDREFDAEITEQEPDQVIAWRAIGDTSHAGRVSFDKVAADKTRVRLAMDYDPQSLAEKVGDKIGVVEKRVEGDLERFKSFIEKRGVETGAWRGEIH